MSEFEVEQLIDTVVYRSSSNWNLRIYLPQVEVNLYESLVLLISGRD